MRSKTSRLRALAWVGTFALSGPALAQSPAPSPVPLTLDGTESPIRVDGHLGDWPSTRMFRLDQPAQVTLGKAFWKGPDDFNGRIFLTYDDQYLYLSALVQKNGEVVGAVDADSLWNGDCLELFLSTHPDFTTRVQLSRGDYHIGFSPGSGCKSPRMYCFNKNTSIDGGRIVARKTLKGYLMEACVPLSFLEGLDLGPGKSIGFNVALDEGGPVSGNRIVQLDYSQKPLSWQSPASWAKVQWVGKASLSVPLRPLADLYADLVKDGTQNAVYLGTRDIQGKVLDGSGKPLAGVKVSTWPKSKETLTGPDGSFELDRIKVYDRTVVYGGKEGYATSLGAAPPKGKALVLQVGLLPPEVGAAGTRVGPLFSGLALPFPKATGTDFAAPLNDAQMKALQPAVLKLEAPVTGGDPRAELTILDQFVAYARGQGAEPMIVVPLGGDAPQRAALWVRHVNVEGKTRVRLWAVGEKVDTLSDRPGDFKGYNAYDYVNDFRDVYNAMKKEDPSILVMGPELAWKYAEGEQDWITPFIRYDGDIVNMVSLYRYGALHSAGFSAKSFPVSLDGERALLRSLRDKISENSDNAIPLLVTGGAACAEPVTAKTKEEAASDEFEAALWEAEEKGFSLEEGAGMCLFSLEGIGLTGAPAGMTPTYWALKLWSGMIHGKILNVETQIPNLSAYATQDPRTRDVTLLIVNKGDRYSRPKMQFNGKEADLMVDAGLDQRFDYEIPSYSISLLKVKADRSPGQALLYTSKMARTGNEPLLTGIRPW